MEKQKILLKICLVVTLFTEYGLGKAASPLLPPLSTYFSQIAQNADIVVALPGQGSIAIVGNIDAQTVLEVKRFVNEQAELKTLYIDSGGGDVSSAIELANIVRDQKIRLVVAGRCLSACANYIFSAAKFKDVLPGSLIGIHESSFYYSGAKTVISVSRSNKDDLVPLTGDSSLKEKIAELLEKENEFYKRAGISKTYHQAFSDYLERRKSYRATGTSSENCPTVDFWILTRRDLEEMGVTGMDKVWMPKNMKEAQEASTHLGLDSKKMFFGDISRLSQLCRPASGFLSKLRNMLGGF